MDVSLVMVPIFGALYNTGRRKHQQHLINHNLSQIRIHYHQEAGGPFPSVSGLHGRKMRLEASCDSRQFCERKNEYLMYDCHGNACPRCQGDCSDKGWDLAIWPQLHVQKTSALDQYFFTNTTLNLKKF